VQFKNAQCPSLLTKVLLQLLRDIVNGMCYQRYGKCLEQQKGRPNHSRRHGGLWGPWACGRHLFWVGGNLLIAIKFWKVVQKAFILMFFK